MSAELVMNCQSEFHFTQGETKFGRTCSREEGHEGAHYGTLPIPQGYRPICWEGDDRPKPVT